MPNKIAKVLIIIFVLIVLVGLVFGGNFFFNVRLGGRTENDELVKLQEENQALKSEIKQFENLSRKLPVLKSNYLAVAAYAGYPFNIKKVISLGGGKNQSIKENMIVVLDGALIGQINDVFDNYSLAKTIFEPDWQITVVIGENRENGLLTGGIEPQISLIPKDSKVKTGDLVYPADPAKFPPNLILGKLGEIKQSESHPFMEAVLIPCYNLNEIKEVFIIMDY